MHLLEGIGEAELDDVVLYLVDDEALPHVWLCAWAIQIFTLTKIILAI